MADTETKTRTIATEEEIKTFIKGYKKQIFDWNAPFGRTAEGTAIKKGSTSTVYEGTSAEYVFALESDIEEIFEQ